MKLTKNMYFFKLISRKLSNIVETTKHFQYNIVSAYSSLQQKLMQTKNHGWFDAGLFNQKPSIKTTPAQCPAAATGFIKLILGLCAMQELPSRQATPNQRWPNVGLPSTTLDQRHTKIESTCRVRQALHMKISRAYPPAKIRPRPKAA